MGQLTHPQPQKRPKASLTRFEAAMPNASWQADITHYRLAGRGAVDVEILSWIDDHSRFALSVTGHIRVTGPIVVDCFRDTAARHGTPASTLIHELHTLLDAFVDEYNTRRPHRSLPHRATPATAYTTRPKATPGDRSHDSHDRVRHDRVDKAGKITLRHQGRLYSIGIGRTHSRTRVIVLVHDLDIRVINAATGEVLRHLTLDPTRRYQPTGQPPGRKQQEPPPE